MKDPTTRGITWTGTNKKTVECLLPSLTTNNSNTSNDDCSGAKNKIKIKTRTKIAKARSQVSHRPRITYLADLRRTLNFGADAADDKEWVIDACTVSSDSH